MVLPGEVTHAIQNLNGRLKFFQVWLEVLESAASASHPLQVIWKKLFASSESAESAKAAGSPWRREKNWKILSIFN